MAIQVKTGVDSTLLIHGTFKSDQMIRRQPAHSIRARGSRRHYEGECMAAISYLRVRTEKNAWHNGGVHVWIKQHLRIKALFGTSENAVKTQIWIAFSVYALVAIVKKRLNLPRSLYENLQILSLTLCEQMPLDELLAQIDTDQNPSEAHNQMNLFD
jgi:hypothetical protein